MEDASSKATESETSSEASVITGRPSHVTDRGRYRKKRAVLIARPTTKSGNLQSGSVKSPSQEVTPLVFQFSGSSSSGGTDESSAVQSPSPVERPVLFPEGAEEPAAKKLPQHFFREPLAAEIPIEYQNDTNDSFCDDVCSPVSAASPRFSSYRDFFCAPTTADTQPPTKRMPTMDLLSPTHLRASNDDSTCSSNIRDESQTQYSTSAWSESRVSSIDDERKSCISGATTVKADNFDPRWGTKPLLEKSNQLSTVQTFPREGQAKIASTFGLSPFLNLFSMGSQDTRPDTAARTIQEKTDPLSRAFSSPSASSCTSICTNDSDHSTKFQMSAVSDGMAKPQGRNRHLLMDELPSSFPSDECPSKYSSRQSQRKYHAESPVSSSAILMESSSEDREDDSSFSDYLNEMNDEESSEDETMLTKDSSKNEPMNDSIHFAREPKLRRHGSSDVEQQVRVENAMSSDNERDSEREEDAIEDQSLPSVPSHDSMERINSFSSISTNTPNIISRPGSSLPSIRSMTTSMKSHELEQELAQKSDYTFQLNASRERSDSAISRELEEELQRKSQLRQLSSTASSISSSLPFDKTDSLQQKASSNDASTKSFKQNAVLSDKSQRIEDNPICTGVSRLSHSSSTDSKEFFAPSRDSTALSERIVVDLESTEAQTNGIETVMSIRQEADHDSYVVASMLSDYTSATTDKAAEGATPSAAARANNGETPAETSLSFEHTIVEESSFKSNTSPGRFALLPGMEYDNGEGCVAEQQDAVEPPLIKLESSPISSVANSFDYQSAKDHQEASFGDSSPQDSKTSGAEAKSSSTTIYKKIDDTLETPVLGKNSLLSHHSETDALCFAPSENKDRQAAENDHSLMESRDEEKEDENVPNLEVPMMNSISDHHSVPHAFLVEYSDEKDLHEAETGNSNKESWNEEKKDNMAPQFAAPRRNSQCEDHSERDTLLLTKNRNVNEHVVETEDSNEESRDEEKKGNTEPQNTNTIPHVNSLSDHHSDRDDRLIMQSESKDEHVSGAEDSNEESKDDLVPSESYMLQEIEQGGSVCSSVCSSKYSFEGSILSDQEIETSTHLGSSQVGEDVPRLQAALDHFTDQSLWGTGEDDLTSPDTKKVQLKDRSRRKILLPIPTLEDLKSSSSMSSSPQKGSSMKESKRPFVEEIARMDSSFDAYVQNLVLSDGSQGPSSPRSELASPLSQDLHEEESIEIKAVSPTEESTEERCFSFVVDDSDYGHLKPPRRRRQGVHSSLLPSSSVGDNEASSSKSNQAASKQKGIELPGVHGETEEGFGDSTRQSRMLESNIQQEKTLASAIDEVSPVEVMNKKDDSSLVSSDGSKVQIDTCRTVDPSYDSEIASADHISQSESDLMGISKTVYGEAQGSHDVEKESRSNENRSTSVMVAGDHDEEAARKLQVLPLAMDGSNQISYSGQFEAADSFAEEKKTETFLEVNSDGGDGKGQPCLSFERSYDDTELCFPVLTPKYEGRSILMSISETPEPDVMATLCKQVSQLMIENHKQRKDLARLRRNQDAKSTPFRDVLEEAQKWKSSFASAEAKLDAQNQMIQEIQQSTTLALQKAVTKTKVLQDELRHCQRKNRLLTKQLEDSDREKRLLEMQVDLSDREHKFDALQSQPSMD